MAYHSESVLDIDPDSDSIRGEILYYGVNHIVVSDYSETPSQTYTEEFLNLVRAQEFNPYPYNFSSNDLSLYSIIHMRSIMMANEGVIYEKKVMSKLVPEVDVM